MQAYPQDSETAGPHFWATMHNVVAKYPKNPSPHEKLRFKHWLEYTIDHYVCYDPCTKNARRYIRNHPPDVSSRNNLSAWLCNFHNHVRENQGKKAHNCDLVLGAPTAATTIKPCIGCSTAKPATTITKPEDDPKVDEQKAVPQLVSPSPNNSAHNDSQNKDYEEIDGVMNTVQVLPDVSNALHKYKKASTQIFKELCREDHLPYPDIYYKPCPAMPETSCTSFPVDNNGNVTGKASIYFHPHVYNAKTVAHEYKHYYAKMKGLDGLAADEEEIEKRAIKFIEEKFPSDEKTLALGEVHTKVYAEKKVTRFEQRYGDLKDRWKSRFPRFGSTFKEERSIESQDSPPTSTPVLAPNPQEEGFLHHFDSLYQPLEQHFGLDKEWLNAAYSPELIASITQTIIEANFSPVGSLLFSTLLGLGLGGYVMASKSTLAQGDKILLTEMSAHFVTNTVRYANRDAMQFVMDDVERLGAAVINMDLGQIANILVGRSMFGGYDDGMDLTHTPLPPLFPTPRRLGPPRLRPDDLLFAQAAAPQTNPSPHSGGSSPSAQGAGPSPGTANVTRFDQTMAPPLPNVQRQSTPSSVPVKGTDAAPQTTPAAAPSAGLTMPQVMQVSNMSGLPPGNVQQLYNQFESTRGGSAMSMGMGMGRSQQNVNSFLSWLRGHPILLSRQAPKSKSVGPLPDDMLLQSKRKRMQDPGLVSGVDEEGFYHGEQTELAAEGEYEAEEGEYEAEEGEYESYHGQGGGSNNSINLGGDGYYQ